MKKFISVFIIVMTLTAMFAGCGKTEVVAEENTSFSKGIIVEEIITEEIIVEDIIAEDIIEETVWVSPEYRAEIEYDSRQNGT